MKLKEDIQKREKEMCVQESGKEKVKDENSERPQLLKDILAEDGAPTSRLLRLSRPKSEDEEEPSDFTRGEEDWKKTIMVGSEYQASIPEDLCKYDDALPYENEDKLLWNPNWLREGEIESYLVKSKEAVACDAQTVHAIPLGIHTRDDEQAMYLLLQCGYNIEEALRRRKMSVVAPTDTMSLWSEEECSNFESGLRAFGKDFRQIQQHKVRTRSVGELVHFYYLWKKTERHDRFASKSRLEKKKYCLHPGITDFMDRFLEEQEVGGGGVSGSNNNNSSSRTGDQKERCVSPNVQCLIYGDRKRQQSDSNNDRLDS